MCTAGRQFQNKNKNGVRGNGEGEKKGGKKQGQYTYGNTSGQVNF